MSSKQLSHLGRFWQCCVFSPKKETLLNSQWEPWYYFMSGYYPSLLITVFKSMKNDTSTVLLHLVSSDFSILSPNLLLLILKWLSLHLYWTSQIPETRLGPKWISSLPKSVCHVSLQASDLEIILDFFFVPCFLAVQDLFIPLPKNCPLLHSPAQFS